MIEIDFKALDTAKALLIWKCKRTRLIPFATSYLSKQMECDYNFAATLMAQLEHEGFISQPNRIGERHIRRRGTK